MIGFVLKKLESKVDIWKFQEHTWNFENLDKYFENVAAKIKQN